MYVREYRDEDAEELMNLFHDTVHSINTADYSAEQVEAWAPAGGKDLARWQKRFAVKQPLVAVADGTLAGFAEIESDGHIDCFYVHKDWQRKGVGLLLMSTVLERAAAMGILRLFAEVSITARGFFERNSFSVLHEQEVSLRGQKLKNFVMERRIEE